MNAVGKDRPHQMRLKLQSFSTEQLVTRESLYIQVSVLDQNYKILTP